tara:strand:- start:1318 stop:1542 length:225 start_codon:yes stop_codon:yes gene_type:complete
MNTAKIISDFENDMKNKTFSDTRKNKSKIPKRVHQKKNASEKLEYNRMRKKMFHLIKRKMNQRTISKGEDYNYA